MEDKGIKKENFLYYFFGFLTRFAHWFDLVVFYFLTDYIYKNQFANSKIGIICYIPLVIQLYFCFKYEYMVLQSKATCNTMLLNGRVMGFAGKQGAGKSSFATYLASFKRFSNVYTNTPVKIRKKYTAMLEEDIYLLNKKIPDYSLIMMDEATLFWHNILSTNKNKLSNELYAQEIMTQCVRHFFDGNIFYMSTDLNRLPPVIRENVGVVNFALQQGNKKISFICGPIFVALAKMFGYKFRNGLRYWDLQQFEKIPDRNYTFDLAQQEKDQNLSNYANLLRIYCFDNPNIFDYNDRFLAGVYQKLEQHQNQYWESLNFDEELLKKLGYGKLIEFFGKKYYVNLEKKEPIKIGYIEKLIEEETKEK